MDELEQARDRAECALRAAQTGADVAEEAFRTTLEVESKTEKTDLVTQTDRDAQEAVVDVISETFPNERIVGEEDETLKSVPESGPAWIVDPIDGTNNYVRGVNLFGSVVAAVVDGEAVAGATVCPALGDTYRVGPDGVFRNDEPIGVSEIDDPEAAVVCPTYWWDFDHRDQYTTANRALLERFGDLRRFGSAQLTLALVACGGLEGAITNLPTKSWDTVAGVAMIRSAGGTVTDLEGNRWHHDSTGLVASNGHLHEQLLDAAREIES